MNCPQCRQTIREGARFCDSCGFSIGSRAAEAAPPAAFAETVNTDPLVGHTLDGKYQLIEQLGKGGMGVVYRAERVLVGDEVAVKILRSEYVAEPEALARFRREARAAARLRHPNIVTIYDYGEAGSDDAPAYIVMELLRGQPLRDLLRSERRLEPSRVVALMRGICAGIGTAHRNHIVHRDIKPDNVIVLPPDEEEGRERETVKVVDFGIAKLRDPAGGGTLTQKGFQPGTVHYMSPEQCRGDDLDMRSDVYSLGTLCYEMLSGRPPFTGETRTGVISKHLFDPPPSLPDDVPDALSAVVMRALAKEPDARQADAAMLARELQAAEQEDYDAEATELHRSGATPLNSQTASLTRPTQPQTTTPKSPDVQTSPQADTLEPSPGRAPTEAIVASEDRAGRSSKSKLIVTLVLLLLGGAAVAAGVYWTQRKTGPSPAVNERAASNPTPATNQPPNNKQSVEAAGTTKDQPVPPAGMTYVPGGEFTMGLNGRDGGDEYERPAHQVTVKPFFMDIYEVTNEEYEKFIKATDNLTPPTWTNKTYPAGTARQPVTGVTWHDARAYASWAGKRLPTEEEWEFAARGSEGRRYPWGAEWQANLANADGAASGIADVGTYKGASPFGAFDMVGNAWEWTDSDLRAYPGGQLPATPASNTKVLRGGSFKSNKNQATATYRFGWRANGEATYAETGFRCVRDITSVPVAP